MSESIPKAGQAFFRYLTWSDEDERWGMFCTDAGHSETAPGTVYPPDRDAHPGIFRTVAEGRILADYQLVYVTKGKGVFRSGEGEYEVQPGSVLVLFPGLLHSYRPDIETGWTEYWVGFRGEHADRLQCEGFLTSERPLFHVGLRNSLLAHYLQVIDLVRGQEPLYQLKAGSLILGLIAELLSGERKAVQASHSEDLVSRAKFLMEAEVDGEVNLNAIADSLGVSTSHLNKVFKAWTAMTPYRYFIGIKIGRAKELLERGLPVKEVARLLGFSDEYYFSRLFKNKTGSSPSRWKPFGCE
jgi:AraC-like DNA-binding protein